MKYELVSNEELEMDVMQAKNSAGNVSARMLNLREFRQKYGLTNQEAKRQHEKYLKRDGKSGAINAVAMIQNEGLLLQRFRETNKGYSFSLIKPQYAEYKHGRGKRTVTPKQATESLSGFSGADRMTVAASAFELMSASEKEAFIARLSA